MRFPVASTMAACFIAGTVVGLQATEEEQCQSQYGAYLDGLEDMHLATFDERQSDTFFIESASWDSVTRSLIVNTRTFHEKGTLLTLMGLPESTWVDDFEITSDYSADFRVSIPAGHEVPCYVAIRSAFERKIVDIENAPDACSDLVTLQSGNMNAAWGRELFGRDFDRRLLAANTPTRGSPSYR